MNTEGVVSSAAGTMGVCWNGGRLKLLLGAVVGVSGMRAMLGGGRWGLLQQDKN